VLYLADNVPLMTLADQGKDSALHRSLTITATAPPMIVQAAQKDLRSPDLPSVGNIMMPKQMRDIPVQVQV